MTPERQERIAAFLAAHGWEGAESRPLAGDASFRRYVRLERRGTRAVLMDAPPPHEDVRPFIVVARHLLGLGYSAPVVLAADPRAGLVLLEDLGDGTYTRLLRQGADEAALYGLAVDLLCDLHARPSAQALPAGIASYDDARFLDEAALLVDWFAPAVKGPACEGKATADAERAAYLDLWRGVLPLARAVPETLVLRDYHVDNLIHLPEREGVRACGLLDFQDAVRGPLTYDLMSLLEDARRDIDPALIADMRARYLSRNPGLDPSAFDTSWAVLAAQRHAKVIGIFTRLMARDGKDGYLVHIPRVWGLLERALAHPALESLRDWFDRNFPPDLRKAPS